jgi:hypothetical protein
MHYRRLGRSRPIQGGEKSTLQMKTKLITKPMMVAQIWRFLKLLLVHLLALLDPPLRLCYHSKTTAIKSAE